MNSLKTLFIVAALGIAAYVAYVAYQRDSQEAVPPKDAMAWPNPPKTELPDDDATGQQFAEQGTLPGRATGPPVGSRFATDTPGAADGAGWNSPPANTLAETSPPFPLPETPPTPVDAQPTVRSRQRPRRRVLVTRSPASCRRSRPGCKKAAWMKPTWHSARGTPVPI